ncbi:peptidyl-prolyl cis-trans isomerase [Rubritalea tangerina]|uniref:Peptidyl-prolyl cis-trans isomerase n=2 Tax=Rubritalea tangerina TaxID=430798 RepID=A0ABW4ZFI3_9BACT
MTERLASFFRSVYREPMLHFLLGAVLIAWLLQSGGEEELPVIVVDEAKVKELVREAEAGTGNVSSLSAEATVSKYIRGELMYREALKRELYRNGSFRDSLVREMYQQLEPVIAEPTEEQLRAFYKENKERYRAHPSVSFEHVSWPNGEEDIPENIGELLESGMSVKQVGRPMPMKNPMPETLLPLLERQLGKDAAGEVMESKEGEWVGPIRSNIGVHYVRVLSINRTGELPYERVAVVLKGHWLSEQRERAVEESLRELAREYRIEVPERYRGSIP